MKKIYVCSVSFGKDSLAMLLKLIREKRRIDIVIFYNSGMEFQAIYDIRDRVKEMLERIGIPFVELKPQVPFLIKMLCHEVNANKKNAHFGYEWCGGNCRWGTSDKIFALKQFYNEHFSDYEVFEYVGIAADETCRIKNDVHKIYPLIEWGMTENDCLNYCYDNGFFWIEDNIRLYEILDRVSCWCCRNKNLKELKNIYIYLPKYWSWLRGLQHHISRPFKNKYSIFELEERFKKEIEKEEESKKYVQLTIDMFLKKGGIN